MLTQQDLAGGIRDIPPLKDVVIQALDLLDEPACDFHQVESTIARDMGLTTRVLSVANSAFYARDIQVNNIREAFLRLGIDSIRNIVRAAGALAQFPGKGGLQLDHQKLWEHNMAVGVAARVMARARGSDAELAFTAGLLHDIGKFVLDLNFPKLYENAIAFQKEHNCSLLKAEREILGVDHTAAGSLLSQRWNFAAEIEEALRNHHAPNDTDSDTTLIVHIADRLAKTENIGFGGDRVLTPLSFDILDRLKISEGWIENLLPEINDEINYSRSMVAA